MTGMTIVRLIDNIVPEENLYQKESGENVTNPRELPLKIHLFPEWLSSIKWPLRIPEYNLSYEQTLFI